MQLTLCQNENSDRPTNALNDEMPTSAIIKGMTILLGDYKIDC